MKVLSELRKQQETQILSEIEKIAEQLKTLDSKSSEFAELLASMKEKINQMSDE